MSNWARQGRYVLTLLSVLGGAWLLALWMGPSPQLSSVPSAKMWRPPGYEAGVTTVSNLGEGAPRVMPSTWGTLSDYVDGPRTYALPYFEAGTEPQRLRTIQYSIEISTQLRALGLDRQRVGQRPHTPQYGVLMMQVINGGDIFLNGTWVQGLPRSDAMERRVWYQPLLIPLPGRLLRPVAEENVLTVVQTTYEPYLLMPKMHVGRIDDLTRVASVVLFLSSTLANTSNLFCLIAGIFMVGAWVASPREKVFGLAGGASILWALLFTLALWSELPVRHYEIWRWVLYACEAGVMTMMALFVLSFAQVSLSRRASFWLWSYAALAPLIYGLGGRDTENWLDRYWTLPSILFYVYACVRLAQHGWQTRSLPAMALLFQSFVCAALAFHDYAVVTGILNQQLDLSQAWAWWQILAEPIYLTHLGLPLLLLVMGYVLLHEYRLKVNQVHQANDRLQIALAAREAELRISHEAQRRLVRQEAQRQERERIYQDVHDGIGSRLVSLLFMLRAGTSSREKSIRQVEACMTDLRAVITAHVDDNTDIQSAVFELCVNLEAQLEGAAVQLSYDIDEGEPVVLDRAAHLHLLRACQEMITNAIKHSGAQRIWVRLRCEATQLRLSVADDGQWREGESEPARGEGKGLKGMRLRAQLAGGQCELMATPGGGTTVVFTIPRQAQIGSADTGTLPSPGLTT